MTPTIRRAWLAPMLLSAALMPLAGQADTITGSGRSAAEVRSVPAFEAIALTGSIDLRVHQGTPQSVEVSADDNLLPLLETTVDEGDQGPTLRVGFKRGGNISTRSPIRVSVVVPQLRALSGAGSGDMKIESFDTPSLRISLARSGDAEFNGLRTDDLGIGISGSGKVSGGGRALRLKVSIAGSGDVELFELQADDVSVKIAGSGEAEVNAHKQLSVRIAGSGDVSYRGDAALSASVAGSGSVQKK